MVETVGSAAVLVRGRHGVMHTLGERPQSRSLNGRKFGFSIRYQYSSDGDSWRWWWLLLYSADQYSSEGDSWWWWLLLYSAILRSRSDSLHVILHERLAFYSAFLNIRWSAVIKWLVPHETAAVSVQVLCTPYNHVPCHFMQSHIRRYMRV